MLLNSTCVRNAREIIQHMLQNIITSDQDMLEIYDHLYIEHMLNILMLLNSTCVRNRR